MEKLNSIDKIAPLASNATVAQRIAKINELVDLINSMWFTDGLEDTE
jgi:hypothetical protein